MGGVHVWHSMCYSSPWARWAPGFEVEEKQA